MRVDAVVVSYNSSRTLRACVEPLVGVDDVRVIVVDNASADGSVEAVAGLDVDVIALPANGGFAHGCNVGWRAGSGDAVLFLNPDARIHPADLRVLAGVLERGQVVGAVAPRIVDDDGSLDYSLRRFPRLRSTYARALFLHRVFPHRSWTDEVVREPAFYERASSPDWVSGACVLVRRSSLERLAGMDERFFMYCEDIDLCRRLRDAGEDVRYEPSAVVVHEGGASAPRTALTPVLAASRIRYAAKHWSPWAAALERVGVALESLTRLAIARGGVAARRGHAKALIRAISPGPRS